MKVEIYTTAVCPYCMRAKALLNAKGISFAEVSMEGKPQELQALKERTGWRTVPQIFIDGKLIGGYNELAELDRKGALNH